MLKIIFSRSRNNPFLLSFKWEWGLACFLLSFIFVCYRIDNWKREHILQFLREKVKRLASNWESLINCLACPRVIPIYRKKKKKWGVYTVPLRTTLFTSDLNNIKIFISWPVKIILDFVTSDFSTTISFLEILWQL